MLSSNQSIKSNTNSITNSFLIFAADDIFTFDDKFEKYECYDKIDVEAIPTLSVLMITLSPLVK